MIVEAREVLLALAIFTIGSVVFEGVSAGEHKIDSADRWITSSAKPCDSTVSEYLNELNGLIAQSPEEPSATGTAIVLHVCDADKVPDRLASFVTRPESEIVELALLFASGAESEHWLFAFQDDENITDEVFGDRNLLTTGRRETRSIALQIAKSQKPSQLITIIAVDASNRDHTVLPHSSTIATAALLDQSIVNRFDVDYVEAVQASVNPHPNYLSLQTRERDESGERELVFSTQLHHKQLSVIPVRTKDGVVGEVNCGQASDEIISVRLGGWESVSIHCDIVDDIDELIFIYLADYFTPNDDGAVEFTGLIGLSPIDVFH